MHISFCHAAAFCGRSLRFHHHQRRAQSGLDLLQQFGLKGGESVESNLCHQTDDRRIAHARAFGKRRGRSKAGDRVLVEQYLGDLGFRASETEILTRQRVSNTHASFPCSFIPFVAWPSI